MKRWGTWTVVATWAFLATGCLNLRRQYRDQDASPDARDARLDTTSDIANDLSIIDVPFIDVPTDSLDLDVPMDTTSDVSITDGTIDSLDSSVGPDGDAASPQTCPTGFTDQFYPSPQSPTHLVCRPNAGVQITIFNAVAFCSDNGWRSWTPSVLDGMLEMAICDGTCAASPSISVPLGLSAMEFGLPFVGIGNQSCGQHLRFGPRVMTNSRYYRLCLEMPYSSDQQGYWSWAPGQPTSSSSNARVLAESIADGFEWFAVPGNFAGRLTIVCEM